MFWVLILAFVWKAVFAASSTVGTFTQGQMLTYIVLAFSLNALLGWTVSSSMMRSVRDGDVAFDMVRPTNYFYAQLTRSIGVSLVEGLGAAGFVLVVGMAWLKIQPPATAASCVLFLVSAVLGYFTKATVLFLTSLLSFWVSNSVGLLWAQQAVLGILSGVFIPVSLMPFWLRSVVDFFPLRGVVATPVEIYLGATARAPQMMLIQAVWLTVLFTLANMAWRRAFRIVSVPGG